MFVWLMGVVVGTAACNGSGAERTNQCAAEVHQVWNAQARTAYLARAGTSGVADDDVRWFENYANRLARLRGEVCTSKSPDRERDACSLRALKDLRAALKRTRLLWWPRLQDLDQCEGWQITVAAKQSIRPSPALVSPDGKRRLIAEGREWTLVDSAAHKRAVGLEGSTRMIRWLPDDRLIIQREASIELFDLVTGSARRLAIAEQIDDVAPDLQHAAIWRNGQTLLATLDEAGLRITDAFLPQPYPMQTIFSPSGRKLASWDYPEGVIRILDVVSLRVKSVPYRAHLRSTGLSTFAWRGEDSILIGGSNEEDVQGALWELKVGGDAQAETAPIPWFVAPRGAALTVQIAGDALAVVTQSLTVRHSGVLRDGRLIENVTIQQYIPRAYNSFTGALLYERDMQSVELLPSGSLRAVPTVEGFEYPWFSYLRGELIGITAHDQQLYFLSGDGRPLPLQLTMRPTEYLLGIECMSGRCIVVIGGELQIRLLALSADATTEKAPSAQEIAAISLEGRMRSWALSADAASLAISTEAPHLLVFNLKDKSRHVEEIDCDFAERLTFSRRGEDLFFSCVRLAEQRWELMVTPINGQHGQQRSLFTSSEWLSGLALSDEDQIFFSTVGYERSLLTLQRSRR